MGGVCFPRTPSQPRLNYDQQASVEDAFSLCSLLCLERLTHARVPQQTDPLDGGNRDLSLLSVPVPPPKETIEHGHVEAS